MVGSIARTPRETASFSVEHRYSMRDHHLRERNKSINRSQLTFRATAPAIDYAER